VSIAGELQPLGGGASSPPGAPDSFRLKPRGGGAPLHGIAPRPLPASSRCRRELQPAPAGSLDARSAPWLQRDLASSAFAGGSGSAESACRGERATSLGAPAPACAAEHHTQSAAPAATLAAFGAVLRVLRTRRSPGQPVVPCLAIPSLLLAASSPRRCPSRTAPFTALARRSQARKVPC
jgi:hypothetical protein